MQKSSKQGGTGPPAASVEKEACSTKASARLAKSNEHAPTLFVAAKDEAWEKAQLHNSAKVSAHIQPALVGTNKRKSKSGSLEAKLDKHQLSKVTQDKHVLNSPLRKKEKKLQGNSHFNKLRASWALPVDEELVRAFDVAYRKPLNAHGALYIFENHLCFSTKNRNIKWAVVLAEVTKIEIRKGNHSPKTFCFLHLGDGASYVMHKFRGRTGRNRKEMMANVVLAWEHAKGNRAVDLALLRVSGAYALKHPLLKQMLQPSAEGEEEEDDDEEPSGEESVVLAPTAVAVEANSEFWTGFGAPVLPPDQHDSLPDDLKSGLPADLDQPDKEILFPLSLEKTWQLLFSDNSTYIGDYQQKNGAFDYHADHWNDKKTYFSRDIKFSKPIQSALLRGTCVVTQVQRACVVFAGKLLHFGESTMDGVPKGDCFTVKSMYEMMDGGDATKIRYWAWVDWHKSGGMLKGPIGSSTTKAALQSFDLQMEYVRSKIPRATSGHTADTDGTPTEEDPPSLSSSTPDLPELPAGTSTKPTQTTSTSSPASGLKQPSTKKPSSGFGPLSLLEVLLLGLVVFFLMTTLYYRWTAASLASAVAELQGHLPPRLPAS